MSGIYIHIPFCKKACHYCDFHFSTSFKYKGEMIKALHNEILIRKDELKNENPLQISRSVNGSQSSESI